jgi:hypothetical protein
VSEVDRAIRQKYGDDVADALEFAAQHRFPPLNRLRYLSSEVAMEDRIRQLDHTIRRFIENFENSTFFETFQTRQTQRNLAEASRTTEERARRRVSGKLQHWEVFEAIQTIPNGYYSHGKRRRTIQVFKKLVSG